MADIQYLGSIDELARGLMIRDRDSGSSTRQLGSLVDDVRTVLSSSQQYLDIVKAILSDPALPRVADKIRAIQRLEQAEARKEGADPQQVGIGLRRLDTALGVYLAARRNPVLLWAGLAAILAVPFAVGYLLGSRKS